MRRIVGGIEIVSFGFGDRNQVRGPTDHRPVIRGGLPEQRVELLREFAEYRYLVYGADLVAMMLAKPEGLIPEARRELELQYGVVDKAEPVDEPAEEALAAA